MAHRSFPFDDPPVLLAYTRDRARAELGDAPNDWSALVEGATTMMRRTHSSDERTTLREAALTAIEAARECTPAANSSEWDEKAIIARVTYMRTRRNDAEWCAREAAEIFGIFQAALPVDYDAAVRAISAKSDENPAVALQLSQTASTLVWLRELSPLLAAQQRASLGPWLAIRERILAWFNTSEPQA